MFDTPYAADGSLLAQSSIDLWATNPRALEAQIRELVSR